MVLMSQEYPDVIPTPTQEEIYLLGDIRIDDVGVVRNGEPVTTDFLRANPSLAQTILRACENVYGAPVRIAPVIVYEAKMKELSKNVGSSNI